MAEVKMQKPSGLRRKASLNVTFGARKQKDVNYKKVSKVLQKEENDRTADDNELISSLPNIVKQVKSRLEKKKQLLEREAEVEDSSLVLEDKCRKLADAIRHAQYFVVYSGAGVSTAASIPDYRGSNGIWTRMQQGKDIGEHDLTLAEPTLTHMALFKLYKKGILRHIVSQNCDGLHLRSGLPRKQLSEVHGNMYLEVCTKCNIQVWREFDVTQHTARYAHKTARRCSQCCEPLRDTIVHFGERGSLPWPINWNGACFAAKQADLILCIGSSLKVLKKYPWLWGMDKPVKKRPKLYIVNLQWTPKDYTATLKINGKCDDVMKLVMSNLNLDIPVYDRNMDPIFHHCTKLHPLEEHTIASQLLVGPEAQVDCEATGSHDLKQPVDIKQEIDDDSMDIKQEKDVDDVSIKLPTPDTTQCKQENNRFIDLKVKEEVMDIIDYEEVEVKTEELEDMKHEDDYLEDNESERNIERIVLEIKKEKELWRPFQTESINHSLLSTQSITDAPSGSPSPSCSLASENDEKPFTLQVDVFDKVYSEISKKLLRETDIVYYNEMFGTNTAAFSSSVSTLSSPIAAFSSSVPVDIQPLDLSMPKDPPECQFCFNHYSSAMYCLFYKRRETKLPPSGPVCYCCDSDDDIVTETEQTDQKEQPDSSDRKPINPGWFGKGYRKKLKKKR